MAEGRARRATVALRVAQLLLVLAAGGLWGASRLSWVLIRSFDGLGQPKEVAVTGASWSTALMPLAWVCLAAAVAAVAVRGWP
ncbi:MAG: TIGR02234 family membrane protein, partial [Mycolicibacter sinensis]